MLRKPRDGAKTESGIVKWLWVSITNSDAVYFTDVRYAGNSGLQYWGALLHVGGIKWIPLVKSTFELGECVSALEFRNSVFKLFVCLLSPEQCDVAVDLYWEMRGSNFYRTWLRFSWSYSEPSDNCRDNTSLFRESLLPNILQFVVCQPSYRSTPYSVSYCRHFQAHLTIVGRQKGVPFKIIQLNFLHYMRNSITTHSVLTTHPTLDPNNYYIKKEPDT